jgi:hypothetical protein
MIQKLNLKIVERGKGDTLTHKSMTAPLGVKKQITNQSKPYDMFHLLDSDTCLRECGTVLSVNKLVPIMNIAEILLSTF